MAVLSAAAVRWAPQGKIWNARFLPFWVLCLYLLAGLAVAEAGHLLFRLIEWRSLPRWDQVAIPVLALGATIVFVGGPLGALTRLGRDVGWPNLGNELGDSPADASFVPDWINWNYTGYQERTSYPEYHAIIDTMSSVARKYGCGRAMWEYEEEQNRFGTPEALMLLPYWTNDCIDSMEGLLFESSATTPYHFLDQSELSVAPSDAMLGLPYDGLNVNLGIEHLQMLGVKYYMTFSPQIQVEASANPNLKLVDTTGPWPDPYTIGGLTTTKMITWDIYLVRDSAQVVPLAYEPAVVTGQVASATEWLNLSTPWYQDPARWPVYLAASGPASWPRVPLAHDADPPRVRLPVAVASHITTTDDGISFDVDRIGVPVLVRTSYFPNWQASGAEGPYRVTPDLMVVVPTSKHVVMSYGYTSVDYLGYAFTAAGLAGLGLMARQAPWPNAPRARAGADRGHLDAVAGGRDRGGPRARRPDRPRRLDAGGVPPPDRRGARLSRGRGHRAQPGHPPAGARDPAARGWAGADRGRRRLPGRDAGRGGGRRRRPGAEPAAPPRQGRGGEGRDAGGPGPHRRLLRRRPGLRPRPGPQAGGRGRVGAGRRGRRQPAPRGRGLPGAGRATEGDDRAGLLVPDRRPGGGRSARHAVRGQGLHGRTRPGPSSPGPGWTASPSTWRSSCWPPASGCGWWTCRSS